jgi:hypothetical protein
MGALGGVVFDFFYRYRWQIVVWTLRENGGNAGICKVFREVGNNQRFVVFIELSARSAVSKTVVPFGYQRLLAMANPWLPQAWRQWRRIPTSPLTRKS